MAVPPAFPNVVRFRLIFDLGAGFVGGVGFYMACSATPVSVDDLSAMCAEAGASFNTNLASFMSTAFTLTQANARDLTSGGSEATATLSVAGTDSNTGLAVDTCAVVNYKIARVYRGGKPRSYWPFGTNTSLENDHQWTDAFVSALDTAMAAFFGDLISTVYPGSVHLTAQVNPSFYNLFKVVTSPTTGRARNQPLYRGTTGSGPLIPPDTITAYVTQKYVGSQRRRVRATGS